MKKVNVRNRNKNNCFLGAGSQERKYQGSEQKSKRNEELQHRKYRQFIALKGEKKETEAS